MAVPGKGINHRGNRRGSIEHVLRVYADGDLGLASRYLPTAVRRFIARALAMSGILKGYRLFDLPFSAFDCYDRGDQMIPPEPPFIIRRSPNHPEHKKILYQK